jgi:outer membrane protein, heavy metal efflux system
MTESLLRIFLLAAMLGALGVSAGCAKRASREFSGLEQAMEELRRDEATSSRHHTDGATQSIDALSQLPSEGTISLNDLVLVAMSRNPKLAVARSEVGISAGQAMQASLYPNPRLELSSEEIPFDSGIDDGIAVISVSQPIVIGDRLRAAEDGANAQREASRAQFELIRRETVGEIAQLHAQLLAARQAEALYDELAEVGAQTLNIAKTRFDARAATESEVIRPQIELHQIELARARLMKQKSAAQQQLSLLLGGAVVDAERLSGEVAEQPEHLDLDTLSQFTRAAHPALIVADREIEAAAAQLKRIRAERVPDLEIQAGVGYHGDEDEEIYELGVGATLPLWDNRQGDILSARFALMRARQQRHVIESDLLKRLIDAHADYESALAQLTVVRDQIVPAARRSFEQTQESYRGGHAAFLELLDAQRTLAEARTTSIELRSAAAVARAQITQIIGQFEINQNSTSHPPLPPKPQHTNRTEFVP